MVSSAARVGTRRQGLSVPFTDTFSRPDGFLVAPYIYLGGQTRLGISGQKLVSEVGGTTTSYVALQALIQAVSTSNKLDVSVDFTSGGGNDMAVRYFNNGFAGSGNFYLAQFITNGTVLIISRSGTAGTTQLASFNTGSPATTRFTSDGVTAQFYVNGTKIYDAPVPADMTPAAAVLLYSNAAGGTSGSFDNLSMLPVPV